MSTNELKSLFLNSPRLATKYTNYFEIYQQLLSPYRNKAVTVVEVGVADGGSLHMWRSYFGVDARIIGVDYNPASLKLVEDGFEIYIGNQSDVDFWKKLFDEIGAVDILIDDGGHSNLQTLTTLISSLDKINDGGMIIFEDTHASYMSLYANPSKYSFICQAKKAIDHLHSRSPNTKIRVVSEMFKNAIFSIEFFDSVAAFKINRKQCYLPQYISNESFPLIDESNRGEVSNGNKLISRIFASIYYRDYKNYGMQIKSLAMKLREIVLFFRSRKEISRIKKMQIK